MFKRINPNYFVLALAISLAFIGGAIATDSDPVRDWQISTYFDELERHAEAREAFVSDHIDDYLDDLKVEYDRVIRSNRSCATDNNYDPDRSNCLKKVINVFSASWRYHVFGLQFAAPGDRGFYDTQFTAEQRAMILDWDSVIASVLSEPVHMSRTYHEAHGAFESPTAHPDNYEHRIIHTEAANRVPTFPLASEYPQPELTGITLTETGLMTQLNSTKEVTVNLDSEPAEAVTARFSIDSTSTVDSTMVTIIPTTQSWTTTDWALGKSAILAKTGTVTGTLIIKVEAYYTSDSETILFTETIAITL